MTYITIRSSQSPIDPALAELFVPSALLQVLNG
jgi:hypothetical protein